jgi:hypothetical protein
MPSPALMWRAADGLPVSCVEKVKVLDQNLAEFRAVVADLLEDAALMGCDLRHVRDVLKGVLDSPTLSDYSENTSDPAHSG